MIPTKVYIDFEYNQTNERYLNLISGAYRVGGISKSFWLRDNPENKKKMKEEIIELNQKGLTYVAYNVVAEARSFISLGLNPLHFNWIDLYLEWRMLTNQNHDLAYGSQLIDGKIKFTYPPGSKYKLTEEELREIDSSKPQHSLVACTYKLLDRKIDSKYKNEIRDFIINLRPDEVIPESKKKEILKYNESDLIYLAPILKKMIVELYKPNLDDKDYKKLPVEIRMRGEYAARTAMMESIGYPIDVKRTRNFTKNVPNILKDMAEDINSQNLPVKPFRWNNKEQRYSMQVKKLQTWLADQDFEGWILTDKRKPSISLDAWAKKYGYRHKFPRDNIGAQMLRYLKIKQSLNGFVPKPKTAKNKTTFWDSVGSDGRSRPFMGIYGSQSARSQPKATGFIPLKAAWMRSLISPPEGRAICSIDYGSQEFLLSAIISGDEEMFKAYFSGDPYFYFAKKVKAVPPDAKRENYENIRDLFKSTILGISYNMGAPNLSKKLTMDTGKFYSEGDALELINDFYDLFDKFKDWNDTNKMTYIEDGYIKMPCGWIMWGDNKNWRSVNNVPIQGTGASIMRKAVALSQDRGLEVIYTLHDALYIEYDTRNLESVDILYNSMKEAFTFYFGGKLKKWASSIRLDASIWSTDYKLLDGEYGKVVTPGGLTVKTQHTYIDARSKDEYFRFKEYM